MTEDEIKEWSVNHPDVYEVYRRCMDKLEELIERQKSENFSLLDDKNLQDKEPETK